MLSHFHPTWQLSFVLLIDEHSVISNTNNAWTPLLVVHNRHVAIKPLRWWGGWVHWIVFRTSLYMYYALYFVHVEHSVCHEPISVLILIYIYTHIYIYIYTIPRLFLSLNFHTIKIHVFYLVHQSQLLFILTFVSMPYLFGKCCDMLFNWE